MPRSAIAAAAARFKQLCCLGLPSEAVMPALLRELGAIIPSHGITFFWVGPGGELANLYDENPETPNIGPLYVQEFYNKPHENDLGPGFTESFRTKVGVHGLEQSLKVDLGTFHRSDLYNQVLRPLGYHHFIRVVARDNQGRALGAPMLSRSEGEAGYSTLDWQRLAALAPFLTHMLVTSNEADFALADSERSGIIAADTDGRTLYSTAEGRRLLFLATHPHVAPRASDGRIATLPPPLVRICQSLSKVFSNDVDATAPSYFHRNRWGGFVFKAFWLGNHANGSDMIAISIRHQEPAPTRLVRRIGELRLTGRQAEVCLLLATGHSYDAIAERLGISRHTAIAHGRWVYHVLDVHNRADLVSRLLVSPAPDRHRPGN